MSPVRVDVRVVGRRMELDDHRLRDFLTRVAQPHTWLDAEDPAAAPLLRAHGVERPVYPVVLDGDGVIEGATIARLADAWGLDAPPQRDHYDLVIVGAGPAGLAAAVYAASDGLSTLVCELDVPGGQASHTSAIENFFGFPDGIGGAELARLAGRQAERFAAEVLVLRGVEASRRTGEGFAVDLRGGVTVTAPVVLAAPGMVWRQLEVEGVDALLGRGVYYGAGRSEAAQCGGDPVTVVGAGNSAGQAVLNLANAGARVTMIVRGDRLGKTLSAYLVERIEQHPLIDIHLRTQVTALHERAGQLDAVTTTTADGTTGTLPSRALFLCIGGTPRTAWCAGAGVRTDEAGFILTGPDLLTDGRRPDDWPLDRDPLVLETSVPGLFAAGDVRHGSTKRVGGAVGEGAMAVPLAFRRLGELGLYA